jgi:hypothetical protein
VIALASSANLFLRKAEDTLNRRGRNKRQDVANATNTTNATNSTNTTETNTTNISENTTVSNATNATNSTATNTSGQQNQNKNCPQSAFEEEKPAQAPSVNEPYGAPTNVFGKDLHASNAAGYVGNRSLSISKAPWRIKTCDQVIQITAQRLKDYNDYSLREPAFFTISIYMINMFSGKDNTRLVESINIENVNNVPDIIPGSKSCLDFSDVKNKKRISLCLDDQERVDDVKEALQKIMRCRMGDNLKELPVNTIKKIFEASCLGMNLQFTSKMAGTANTFLASMNLRNQLAGTLAKEGARVTSTNPWEVKYMTPVPGSA